MYTAYILHLAFFGVEFWNIREYTKKQSNNLNKCHGKELQRIFECMFFPVKHCQMSICQRKHFHLTGFHFHFPASQMAWRFHKNTCHSVGKIGGILLIMEKAMYCSYYLEIHLFFTETMIYGRYRVPCRRLPLEIVSFCKTAKEFPLSTGYFFWKHIFILCFFSLFGAARTSPIHQVVFCDQNHQSGVGKSTTGSFEVMKGFWQHDVPFETGWFFRFKMSIFSGYKRKSTFFFWGGGMTFVLALEASCLVQVQGPSGPEGPQGPSEVDLTRERSRSWAQRNDIQRRSPWVTKHFRYLIWRNPHLYKLYGYGLVKTRSQIAKDKVQYLHSRYLNMLVNEIHGFIRVFLGGSIIHWIYAPPPRMPDTRY